MTIGKNNVTYNNVEISLQITHNTVTSSDVHSIQISYYGPCFSYLDLLWGKISLQYVAALQ